MFDEDTSSFIRPPFLIVGKKPIILSNWTERYGLALLGRHPMTADGSGHPGQA